MRVRAMKERGKYAGLTAMLTEDSGRTGWRRSGGVRRGSTAAEAVQNKAMAVLRALRLGLEGAGDELVHGGPPGPVGVEDGGRWPRAC